MNQQYLNQLRHEIQTDIIITRNKDREFKKLLNEVLDDIEKEERCHIDVTTQKNMSDDDAMEIFMR